MSNSISSAFNTLLFLHSRDMTIERPSAISPVSIKVSPSNYSRNLQGPEEIVIKGREFVISKKTLDSVSYPIPKRGDRLKDPELGTSVIKEIIEMFSFGGDLVGFRIRCE